MSERLSRDEQRQKKLIEEARKNGTLPPEVDMEGNLINPHIPEYMSKAPWYLKQEEGAGLRHQRKPKRHDKASLDTWYKRGKEVFVDSASKKRALPKFRKGACKNCGAMTHDAKSCMERPRKIGAWKTGRDIARDEVVQAKLKLSFEEARDRWNGYDPSEHAKTVKLFSRAEEEKRKQVLKDRDAKFARRKGGDGGEGDSESDDSEKEDDILGLKTAGTAVKATVRNLRIREDTAKYLRNLDPDSAYYDPKTRSMRANPNPDVDINEADYAGDNFVKVTGDAIELAKTQVFAWEASGRGEGAAHLQANPTQVALAKKQHEERAAKLKEKRKKELTSKYGVADFVKEAPSDALLVGSSSSQYVEYSRDGRIIKGADSSAISKYEEDTLEGNHTSIWGSYFDKEEMCWGYGCCFSTTRNSYCTGEAGKEAVRASKSIAEAEPVQRADVSPREESQRNGERLPRSDTISAEEIENYKKAVVRADDPMASVDTGELLPMKP